MLKVKYPKVTDHCYYTGEYRDAALCMCNLNYNIPKEIPVIFHKRSNYDYYLMIKELAEEFKEPLSCLGENTIRYINFSVSMLKEVTRIGKKREEMTKTIFYRLHFIDSARFMAGSLSNLVNNLPKGIHEVKCKYGHDKKCEAHGIITQIVSACRYKC